MQIELDPVDRLGKKRCTYLQQMKGSAAADDDDRRTGVGIKGKI
jgi:hypothetical protein